MGRKTYRPCERSGPQCVSDRATAGEVGGMAHSRYPRRGYRIAPATLEEMLQAPVPARFFKGKRDPDLFLCDLDETAWERFDERTCRKLADEVLTMVGRAARTRSMISSRRLPPIPEGMTLADLDLEVRTINCLISAGIHERPQDLQSMAVESVLGIRGFWVKSLVDLLCSLEYVNDHPEARKALRTDAIVSIKHLRAAHRYPRPGHRLAPQTLKEVLLDRIPPHLVRGTRFRGGRLCDLDDTAWEYLSPAVLGRLAGLIVSHAGAAVHHPTIRQRRLPNPPKEMRLEDLRLENRTHNCLTREGYDKRPQNLGKLTVGDLLSIKAFGAKCLVDLLTSLETRVAREGKLDDKLTAEAQALGKMPEVAGIRFTDPRLGGTLRAIDTESDTVAEAVDRLVKRRLDPPDPRGVGERIHHVRDRIRELEDLPLEEELVEIFAPGFSKRDRQIVAEYYGWDGRGGCTLETLGRRYKLSRERIRQICVRSVRQTRDTAVFAPVLDQALAFLAERFPMGLDQLQAELDGTGFSRCRLPVEAIHQAAGFLSRKPHFVIIEIGQRRMAVLPKQAELPRVIVQAAKHVVANFGVGKITEVAAELADLLPGKTAGKLVRETLQALGDFHWLDEKRNWFRLEPLPQYGLPNMIEKVLSVVQRIEVSQLRAAMERHRRSGRSLPPQKILLEFCRQMPGNRVEGNTVISDPPRDWRKVLVGVERGMIEVLTEHGPVMERTAFEELCIRGGMNRFSFNAIVMSSPVIAQYGRSVYGLPVLKIERKLIEDLVARKPGVAPKRVLRAFGETEDGKVFLAYRLSKAAISGGVITIPAAMKRQVKGKFTLRVDAGHKVGTLVAKKGCGWGLGPALRGSHAKQGDHMLLLVDGAKRQANIRIGDKSIFEDIIES